MAEVWDGCYSTCMPNSFDTAKSDDQEKVVGGDVAPPVVEPEAETDAPAEEYVFPDTKLKLNPDKNLDTPCSIQVPNFEEVLFSNPTASQPVEHFHAELLLSTDLVVAE